MARVSGEILINRLVEQAYDCVGDQRNEPIYNPRMMQSEKITEGPIGVGTRFRATARSGAASGGDTHRGHRVRQGQEVRLTDRNALCRCQMAG
jgi:hypothetical protein